MCRQRPGESLVEHSQRISSLLKRMKDAISTKYTVWHEGLKKEFENDCIAAYKLGVLSDNTRSYLIGRNLSTLSGG